MHKRLIATLVVAAVAVFGGSNIVASAQTSEAVENYQGIAPQSAQLGRITANSVNLRSGSGTGFPSLGQVHNGDEAWVIGHGSTNGFVQVVMRTGQNAGLNGWVHQDFIRFPV